MSKKVEALASLIAYWKTQLQGAPTQLRLPIDKQRPAIQTYPGASQPFMLPSTLTQSLKALSQSKDVTLFTALLAAFQTLLFRYTGQEDFLVAAPILNEKHIREDQSSGLLTNILVLRADLSNDPSFSELLNRVREMTMGAYAHQDLPFEHLVENLRSEGVLSDGLSVQVLFVLNGSTIQAHSFLDFSGVPLEANQGIAQFDLALQLMDTPQGLQGRFEYNAALFESASIQRMIGHLQQLLTGALANPEQRVSVLPLLTQAEQYQLLVEWNQTDTDYPREACIHQLFEAQVTCTPCAVAVTFGEVSLTYDELNRRANQLAYHLQNLGIGPEKLVGICMERSVEMMVGLLGILKAGGAYVPLDPTYPRERLAFMLEDAQVSLLLTQEEVQERLSFQDTPVICLDVDWRYIASEHANNPICEVRGINLAYVIYTSGSTGKPKGVAMIHSSLCNLLARQKHDYFPFEGAKILQYASLSFDVSFLEIFSTWCSGGTLVLLSEETRQDPALLLHFLIEKAITRISLPFVALKQLAELIDSYDLVPVHLRIIVTSGEQLQITPLVKQLFDRLAGCSFHNHYGPTESHLATDFVLADSRDQWPALPPIGRPIANTKIYLLDAHLQPVPIGIPGEIYIGGADLTRGYFHRPELTAERFVPNCFSSDQGARLYKTGDLARYKPDGNIEFLGRLDLQVKVRGVRIEIGEIEATLLEHPGVREAVVLTREEAFGEKRLISYLVPRQQSTFTSSELRGFLQARLPSYMVPSIFIILESFPMTPNGKLDRNKLRELALKDLIPSGTYVAPQSPLQEILANAWASVLHLPKVGIHDNFFDIGGDSLLATRIIARLRQTLHIEIPLLSLFEAPTIEEFSDIIEEVLLKEIEGLAEEA